MPAFATLAEAADATGPFDIVDVFRRPRARARRRRARPSRSGAGALWLQLGVVNWEAARIADAAGWRRDGPLHGDRAPPAAPLSEAGVPTRAAPRAD